VAVLSLLPVLPVKVVSGIPIEKGARMPERKPLMRVLGVTAMLVAALGLGVVLGTPGTAAAQEDTTATTTADTTETTVDESTDQSTETERPARGDHDCGDRAGDGASDDASSEESSSSQT
jgi:hypothetical protein